MRVRRNVVWKGGLQQGADVDGSDRQASGRGTHNEKVSR